MNRSDQHISSGVVVAVAVATGLLAGTGAFCLKWLICHISQPLTSGLDASGANWRFLLYPLAGILLTGMYTRYVIGAGIGHGVERMRADIVRRHYRLPAYLVYAPMAAKLADSRIRRVCRVRRPDSLCGRCDRE